MNEPKQMIVMRTDLRMRKGKMIAQGAHASMKVLLDYRGSIPVQGALQEWLSGSFIKICVRVESEEELLEIFEKATQIGIPCSLIKDAGRTEFKGVPTYTCAAIGPDYPAKIDQVTGHLKLL